MVLDETRTAGESGHLSDHNSLHDFYNAAVDAGAFDEATGTYKDTSEGFRAHRSTSAALSAATFTKITFDTEVRDQGADYDNTTGEWTVPATKWYDVGAAVAFQGLSDGDRHIVAIRIDGTENTRLYDANAGAAGDVMGGGTVPLYLTAGQVLTVWAYRTSAGNIYGNAASTFFTAKGRA